MSGTRPKSNFQHGSWEFENFDLIDIVARYSRDFKPHTGVWNQRRFHEALIHLVKMEDGPVKDIVALRYDHDHMIHQLETYTHLEIEPKAKILQYMEALQEAFRYGQRDWRKRVIFEPQYSEKIEAMSNAHLNKGL